MQRVKTDIERFLSWTYREELPKKDLSTSGWDGIAAYGERGGQAEDPDPWELHLRSQRYAIGTPHPEALTLAWLVDGLDDVSIQWPTASKILLGDLAPYLDKQSEFVIRKLVVQPGGLVRAHARMGTRPMWDVWWALAPVKLKNRKPLVQYIDRHGRLSDCTSGQRDYERGGRCPLMVSTTTMDDKTYVRAGRYDRVGKPDDMPAVAEIVSARFEYFVWHSALCELVRRANGSGQLREHQATPPAAPQAPWLTGTERKSRILPALQETGNQNLTLRVAAVVES